MAKIKNSLYIEWANNIKSKEKNDVSSRAAKIKETVIEKPELSFKDAYGKDIKVGSIVAAYIDRENAILFALVVELVEDAWAFGIGVVVKVKTVRGDTFKYRLSHTKLLVAIE